MRTRKRSKPDWKKEDVSYEAIAKEPVVQTVTRDMRVPLKLKPGAEFDEKAPQKESIVPSKNPAFNKVIQELIDLHDKKNTDYSEDNNPFSNFEFMDKYATIMSGVYQESGMGLLHHKGSKLARLFNLLNNRQGSTLNEPIEDTEMDFVVYWILERAYRLHRA